MSKKSARKLFVVPPNKSQLPEVYHNPTYVYRPKADGPYIPTKVERSALIGQIQRTSPGLFQKLLASGRLRDYASEQLSIHGPGILEWGVQKASGYISGIIADGGIPSLIGSPARRNPGGGANQATTRVFDGKANPVSNTSYALSPAPNPKPISVNSGIKPNTFVNDYMTPMENKCSPLHFSNVTLTLPAFAGNPLYGYMMNTICFDIQTRAQEAVGFSLDITNTLSAINLFTAFNNVISALQTYFYYSSIIAYESDSRNKNSGMIACRQLIDTTTLSDYYQLKRRLEDTPCPPRIVNWVRYMSGNFLSSNTQGSPIIKTAPSANCYVGTRPTTSYLMQALDALNTPTNTAVFALLRRCVPKWRIGKLYDVPVTPLYDKNFVTIWANLPACHMPVSTEIKCNTVPNITTAGSYNCFNNNLDGLAFAMSGLWDSTSSFWYPGIVKDAPVSATYRDTRYSYYSVSSVTSFYPVYNNTYLALSRQETVPTVASTLYTPHLFGADRCQNVTGQALLQSGQDTLAYLFETDSLKVKKPVKQYS